jgi:hypothetical protein
MNSDSESIAPGRMHKTYATVSGQIDLLAAAKTLFGKAIPCRRIRCGGVGDLTVKYKHPYDATQGLIAADPIVGVTAGETFDMQAATIEASSTVTAVTVWW